MKVELENAEGLLAFLSGGAVKGASIEGDVITLQVEMPEEPADRPLDRFKKRLLNRAILNSIKVRFLGYSHGILRLQTKNQALALPLQFGAFRERFQSFLDRFSRDKNVLVQDDIISVNVNALIREKTGLEGDAIQDISIRGETISIRA